MQSSGLISFQRSLIATTFLGLGGNGGDITIRGRSVSVNAGTEVTARASGKGNAGDIQINATDKVEISGNDPFNGTNSDRARSFPNSTLTTSIEEKTTGNAGDITIKAGEIFVNNQASSPALDASNNGNGRGGNVSLQANGSIFLIGQDVDENDKVISSRSGDEGLGGGNISLKANGSIYLSNAYLSASSRKTDAGNILLLGNDISLASNSSLVAVAIQSGNAGNITVQSSGSVSIQNSLVNTSFGTLDIIFLAAKGNGGNININGRSVSITDGSEVSTRSFSGSNSGNIQINAKDKIEISGRDSSSGRNGDRAVSYAYSSLTTTSEGRASGVAGEISINTPTLRVSDGASLGANSKNTLNGGNIIVNTKVVELTGGGQLVTSASNSGNAGNITLNTDRILIAGTNLYFKSSESNQAVGFRSGIFASTESSNGGNVTIEVGDLLLLRRNGQISVEAGKNGNGGNITINAPNGFIVAVPSENSDIIANALRGRGGNINIITSGIYGLVEYRPLPIEISDINASSQFGVNGTVEINTPDLDPNRGLINLPAVPLDTEVSQICQPRTAQNQNSFTITGRGGLPPNPRTEPLSSDAVQVDWVTRNPKKQNRSSPEVTNNQTPAIPAPIVEAQGWGRNAKGQVVLTANAPTTPHSSWQTPTECHGS